MLFLLLACTPPTPVDFGDPALLSPLEEVNQAADPAIGELTMASGETDGRYWAHARALVPEDANAVWEALRDPDVCADRRAVDEYTWEDNVLPEFDFSFVFHNTVRNPVTVNYDLTWVHELHEGEISEPLEVVIRFDKTDGTQFIDLLAGSVVITQTEAGTEIGFMEHLEAALRDEKTLEAYLTDLFGDIQATLAGQPLPTYED